MPIIALAELSPVLVAMAAILYLLALEPVRQFLQNLLSRIPIIGGAVAGWVVGGITAAWNDIYGWLQSIIGDVDAFIASLYAPLEALVGGIESALEAAARKFLDILTAVIPGVVAWVQASIVQIYSDLEGAITHAAFDIVSWATTEIAALAVYTGNLIDQVLSQLAATATGIVSWVQASIVQVYSDLGGLVARTADALYSDILATITWAVGGLSALETWTQSAIADAVTWTAGELVAIEAWTQSAIVASYDAVFTNLRGMVDAALRPIWGALAPPAERVIEDIATAYPDIAGDLRSIPQSIPTDIEGAIAALGAIALPLAIHADRCGIPNCRDLGSFPKSLAGLGNLIGDGALLAFLVGAATDPGGMAHDVQSTLGTMGQDVVHYVSDLVT